MQGAEQEIMHQAAVPEPDFVFGGVHIDIHSAWRQFQIKHIGWMTAMIQHISIGLFDRMGD